MEDLRIVFMGTPDFAVGILDYLVQKKCKVVGVITAPDKPAGRGRKLNESAVKKYAKEHNLKVLQPQNLKSEEFLEELNALNPDVQVVVAFRMLPKEVWQLPKKGTFNLHASLLPDYRGAAPINWAIINGEKISGVTTFFIDEKIDTGNIILSKKVDVLYTDHAGDLHDRLLDIGKVAVIETLEKIADDSVETISQPKDNSKDAPKLTKENTKIDWTLSGEQIYNFIRGLSPFPTAWCMMKKDNESIMVKIHKASFVANKHNNKVLDVELSKKYLRVFVADGYIEILEIQLPGKKKYDIQAFLNGLQPDTKVCFF